ncbi:hypothetical protein [Actinomadura sp. 9N215]|uniref:hypothetical protein n=1 Tax=Actinomadura sp. 9N215 TaxID=3375150 RepID=UPI0037B3E8E3
MARRAGANLLIDAGREIAAGLAAEAGCRDEGLRSAAADAFGGAAARAVVAIAAPVARAVRRYAGP